jgi:transglutaminase-like putative cysteine protease
VLYKVRHVTRYRYADAVSSSQHDLHLLPREFVGQHCLSCKLDIQPRPLIFRERVDYFGNRATYVALATPHSELVVVADSLVAVDDVPMPRADDDVPWEAAVESFRRTSADMHVQEMTFPSPFVDYLSPLKEYVAPSFPRGQPLLAACIDLMGRIHDDFVYDPRATTIATPLAEVFGKRRGVCQDFAHLMIACLRGLGLSARYASGYLVTTPPPGAPRLLGVDASHAWLSVMSPRFGFVDLDPTNDCVVGNMHIRLALGRDFGDVTPMRGVIHGGARHSLDVAVDVIPQDESR